MMSFNFVERFKNLKTELEQQMSEEQELNTRIMTNLSNISIPP